MDLRLLMITVRALSWVLAITAGKGLYQPQTPLLQWSGMLMDNTLLPL